MFVKVLVFFFPDVLLVGMCVYITEADAIHILMHCQQPDTLQIHMKQLVTQYNMIYPI